jgi:hypothetical protein
VVGTRFVNYMYVNPGKIESLFAQLNGRVVTERKEIVEKGVKGAGKLGVEVGGILAKLGLAKGVAEGELGADYSKILEITTSLSLDNKLDVLEEYIRAHGQLEEISLPDEASDPHQEYDAIRAQITASEFQHLWGRFQLRIDNLSGDEARQAFSDAVMARSEESHPKYRDFELFSLRTHPDKDQPLVIVPLHYAYLGILYNQAVPVALRMALPMLVRANCILGQDYIIANPIAISTRAAPPSASSTGRKQSA